VDATMQFWIEVAKLLATVAAASVAAWVAYSVGSSQRDIAKQQADTAAEQKRIAAAKLNLELFEERYALFEKVWEFLSEAVTKDELDPLGAGFGNLIPKARFLFGDEIADYMKDISARRTELAVFLHAHKQLLNTGRASPHTDAIYQQQIELQQEAVECFKRFAPYLDFSNWKAQS
jgi:hypothetical protein